MILTKNIRYMISLKSIKLSNENSKKSKALIMHHGMLGSAKNLRPLCKNSRLLNYVDVLLVDARNHGQSQHSQSHSVSNLADDLRQFIQKQTQNYDKFTVLGHSMGGLAVMQMTKSHQQLQKHVQRVIVVDIPCNGSTAHGNWSQEGQLNMLKEVSKINLNQSTSSIFREIQKYSLDSDYANLIKFNIKILPNGTHKWKAHLNAIIKHYNQMTSYSLADCKWKGPVEVIYGSLSNYFQQDQIQQFMKQYPQMDEANNFHKIQGAGHWVHFDKKQAFLNVVEKILQRNK